MAKFYTKNKQENAYNPKRHTISFLLNYSKSIELIKVKNEKFVFFLN